LLIIVEDVNIRTCNFINIRYCTLLHRLSIYRHCIEICFSQCVDLEFKAKTFCHIQVKYILFILKTHNVPIKYECLSKVSIKISSIGMYCLSQIFIMWLIYFVNHLAVEPWIQRDYNFRNTFWCFKYAKLFSYLFKNFKKQCFLNIAPMWIWFLINKVFNT